MLSARQLTFTTRTHLTLSLPCRAHACQVEVPVEVIREVVKTIEVPVEVIVEKKVEVEKTVTVEVPVQIIREGAHSRTPIACSCDGSLSSVA